MQRPFTILLALALDCLGEPPTQWPPVAWMGNLLGWARTQWRGQTAGAQLAEGGTRLEADSGTGRRAT